MPFCPGFFLGSFGNAVSLVTPTPPWSKETKTGTQPLPCYGLVLLAGPFSPWVPALSAKGKL